MQPVLCAGCGQPATRYVQTIPVCAACRQTAKGHIERVTVTSWYLDKRRWKGKRRRPAHAD